MSIFDKIDELCESVRIKTKEMNRIHQLNCLEEMRRLGYDFKNVEEMEKYFQERRDKRKAKKG